MEENIYQKNKSNFLDKFVFFNPIFIDKLEYLDLEENTITSIINLIFIIIIILTLYYFFYDELYIIYYFLIKKKIELNDIEKDIIKNKINEFENLITQNSYSCELNTQTNKYYIKNKQTILKDINGQYLSFDDKDKCDLLINTQH